MSSSLHIGISGWTYAPWRGTFYPKGLKQKDELAFASRQVNSIEINGSFYSMQTPKSYLAWRGATPDGFVFAVKGGRYITHLRRLRDVEGPLANFFASGVLALGEKLGPILWQFPPNFKFDEERIESFLAMLPRDTEAAAAMGRKHDAKLKGRAYLRVASKRPIRYAMEVRHESFQDARFLAVLRRHGVAVVVADTAGKWPYMEDVTAGFTYVRLHGDEQIYVSGYSDAALARWATKIERWKRHGDVYVYFDNDVKVRSPHDAMVLANLLGLRRGDVMEMSPGMEEAREQWPGVRK